MIEFWGKSCGACIDVLPHLRELAEELEGEDLQFVFIADESPDELSDLLEKHAMPGWQGFDPDRSVFDSWAVNATPQTFILDRAGRLVVVTYPLGLTADAIRDLVKGGKLPMTAIDSSALRRPVTAASFGQDDRVQLVIRVSNSEQFERLPKKTNVRLRPATSISMPGGQRPAKEMISRYSWGDYIALNMPASQVFKYAFDVSVVRMEFPDTLESVKLDVTAHVPKASGEFLKPMLQQGLLASLELRSRWEDRVVEVLVFGVSESPCFVLTKKGDPLPEHREGHLASRNTLARFADHLEELLRVPVMSEDPVDEIWTYDLPASGQRFASSDLEACGVSVRREERTIGVLVLEPAKRKNE